MDVEFEKFKKDLLESVCEVNKDCKDFPARVSEVSDVIESPYSSRVVDGDNK